MLDVVAFLENIDEAGVLDNLTGCVDQHYRVDGDNIVVTPNYNKIFGKTAYTGTTGTQAQLVSPSLRGTNPVEIQPINQVLVPTGSDHHDIHPNVLIELEPGEQLQGQVNANPAAAEYHSIGVFLTDKEINPYRGSFVQVAYNTTLAIVANVWNYGDLLFPDNLPQGNWMIIGARLICAQGTVARFILNGFWHRPGFIPSADEDFPHHDWFRHGKLGEWGRFHTDYPPAIEVLGCAAAGSATYYGMLDLVEV